MYLSKLEILGFKSFADKIDLNFKDGLSAIVGPNGSGKTNFVDALRWVLGEQKTSVLRSESMENVIFNGSRNRKPLGLSEVSITIKNNKKILPSEYDEINISRRLYRDGESQYLINKVPARLKDITGLFMDTGLGADSYSVIELKMIENLLNGNPADRRDIFEEAAGIKKFKQNKKETTKKLQNVELDLERLNDILQEIQKNVNSLSRQATKTRRYNTLVNELKEMETKLFAFELLSFRAKLDAKSTHENSFGEQLSASSEVIRETESFLLDLKNKFNEIDLEYQRIIQSELALNNQLSAVNSDLNRNEEKVNSIESTQLKINIEIEEARHLLNSSKENLEKLTMEIGIHKKNESEFSESFQVITGEGKAIRHSFTEKENKVAELNIKINQLKNKIAYNKSVLDRNENLISKNSQNIESENSKISDLARKTEESKINFEKKKNDLELTENDFATAKTELEKINQTKKETEQIISELRNEELEIKSQLNKLHSEINFLESIVVSDESTKHLLKNENWSGSDEKVLLGEIISIDEKYKKALNSSLDNVISSFLINDFGKAVKAINELKSSKKGISHFIITNSKAKFSSTGNKITANGYLGTLSDFIQINEDYREILVNLTQDVLVFAELQSAREFFESNSSEAKYNLVTLDGEFISSKGIISGGSESNQRSKIIGRRNRIKQLEIEIESANKKHKEVLDKLTSAQTSISSLNISGLESNLRILEQKLNSTRREFNQFELTLESIKRNDEHIQETIRKMNSDSVELTKEIETIQTADLELNTQLTDLNGILERERAEMDNEKKNVEEWNNKSKQAEIDLVRIQSEIRYINSEIQKLANSIDSSRQKIDAKERELIANKENKVELNTKITDGLKEKQDLIEKIQIAISQKEISAGNRKNLQEQIANYETTLENARKNFARHSEELHSIELEIASLKTRIEGLYEAAIEKYDVNLDEFLEKSDINEESTAVFDISIAKTDISLHREKMNLLGSVNFSALEDYEEQKNRLDFLLTQITDLKNSQKLLEETIEEINKIATEKFVNTFNEININFKNLFKVLFGQEAEAELKLEGVSPLDGAVYISAKPPFKKPSSIDLLSAGEKTLTAIALLFSIYLVKPSPFCVLDEVDAPLDDSNIDKYIALIRKFSQERDIQFILITHNKKTMESADTLYGLTMEEEGVTKVVSVRLESN
jgi:chromosome segregation protein